jgi:hypothetical protein
MNYVQEFHRICYKILTIESDTGNLPYAKSYANVGLDLTSTEEITSQIPYIQFNLKEWKGEDARNAKKTLKKILKHLKKELPIWSEQ